MLNVSQELWISFFFQFNQDQEQFLLAGNFIPHSTIRPINPFVNKNRSQYLTSTFQFKSTGIFESCSHIIASSEVLTEFFDCNTYVDSNDHSACEDITRFSKKCFDDEFQCSDYSCIPSKWRFEIN